MVPLRFEDRRHTNQLKSQITAYHLHPHAGNLDVNLADGNAKVFSNLAYGTGESRQVNPINVDLNASGAKFSSEKFAVVNEIRVFEEDMDFTFESFELPEKFTVMDGME